VCWEGIAGPHRYLRTERAAFSSVSLSGTVELVNQTQWLPYASLFVPVLVAILALISVVLGQRLGYRFSVALEDPKARAQAVPAISEGLSRLERAFAAWLDPFAGYSAQERRVALS
jgi:hypothetical protein